MRPYYERLDAVDGEAGVAGGAFVAADGDDVAAEPGAAEQDVQEEGEGDSQIPNLKSPSLPQQPLNLHIQAQQLLHRIPTRTAL